MGVQNYKDEPKLSSEEAEEMPSDLILGAFGVKIDPAVMGRFVRMNRKRLSRFGHSIREIDMSAHVKNKAKFERAITYVRTLNPKTFAIETFGRKTENREKPTCEFIGCAVGWMAHDKVFRGLSLVEASQDWLDSANVYNFYVRFIAGDDKRYTHLDAVSALFGISSEASIYLFDINWSQYDHRNAKATPTRVANRMEKFLKTGKLPRELTLVRE